jgi:ribosomal protein S18 acetylase RimI-like enzyme
MNYIKIEYCRKEDIKKCVDIARTPELMLPDKTYPDDIYFRKVLDSDSIFLVAKNGKKILGFLIAHNIIGVSSFLDTLAVSKESRGKGIGRMLVSEYERHIKKEKIHYIFLFAMVTNESTLKFYEKNGFKSSEHDYKMFSRNI